MKQTSRTQRLADLLAMIRETSRSPDLRTAVLDECARILPVDYLSVTSAMIFPPVPGEPAVSANRLGGLKRCAFQDRESLEADYIADFMPEDPYISDVPLEKPTYKEMERLPDWQTISGSRFFNELLVPSDLTRTVRIVVPTYGNGFSSFDLNWDRSAERVRDGDRDLALLIAGQIAASASVHENAFSHRASSDLVMRLADTVGEAAFLIDAAARVHDRNRGADGLLASDRAFAVKGGSVAVEDREADALLRRALSRMTRRASGGEVETLSVPSTTGPVPFKVRLLPVHQGRAFQAVPMIVMLVGTGVHTSVHQAGLQARLTERERHSMLALLELGSEDAAARAMGVSLNTLRSHRKSSYSKLGVSSRKELARALLPPG